MPHALRRRSQVSPEPVFLGTKHPEHPTFQRSSGGTHEQTRTKGDGKPQAEPPSLSGHSGIPAQLQVSLWARRIHPPASAAPPPVPGWGRGRFPGQRAWGARRRRPGMGQSLGRGSGQKPRQADSPALLNLGGLKWGQGMEVRARTEACAAWGGSRPKRHPESPGLRTRVVGTARLLGLPGNPQIPTERDGRAHAPGKGLSPLFVWYAGSAKTLRGRRGAHPHESPRRPIPG